MKRFSLSTLAIWTAPLMAIAALGSFSLAGFAQNTSSNALVQFDGADEARAAMERARGAASAARSRVSEFEQQARDADQAFARVRAETAALAARVQQAEAAIDLADAELQLVQGQRGMLEQELAQRREPIVRLTGALQTLVRRPLSLSLLRPGSLRETVYLGAVLDSTIPQVRARTVDLRSDLDRARKLEGDAAQLAGARRETEAELAQSQQALAAQAERQRLAARRANGAANREATRALALAERARDLDGLIGDLEEAGGLRERLAALQGPVLRPSNLSAARAAEGGESNVSAATTPRVADASSEIQNARPPSPYRLPVDGKIAAGFGESDGGGTRASGLALVARANAQVVAPAKGRVVFAGPYRGFGQIVIIEHTRGWTSLVTGMSAALVEVGDDLVAGSPLGRAIGANPSGGAMPLTLELRRAGKPVNPLEFLSR